MAERYAACAKAFGLTAAAPRLVVRPMNKRWGSLPAGSCTLTLNTRLVEAPVDLIDYVIMHELCHIRHPHHGPAFLDDLTIRMPDWRERKRKLERFML